MARGKVQLKRIDNPAHRQVTFCKRRAGLFKKARELAVLCDADVGVVAFSDRGKLYELASKGTTMQGLMEKYIKVTRSFEPEFVEKEKQLLALKEEVDNMKHEINLLDKGLWSILGGGESTMSLEELNVLEKHLESWIYQIRSTKMNLLVQEIQLLKNKEDVLETANKLLQQKVEEKIGILSVNPTLITNFPNNPLTIPNEILDY